MILSTRELLFRNEMAYLDKLMEASTRRESREYYQKQEDERREIYRQRIEFRNAYLNGEFHKIGYSYIPTWC